MWRRRARCIEQFVWQLLLLIFEKKIEQIVAAGDNERGISGSGYVVFHDRNAYSLEAKSGRLF